MHVHFTQVKERAPNDLRFAKALLCAASVVKANRIQGEATTSHVYENQVFLWLVTNLFDCTFGLAGFCKLNHHWSLFQKKAVYSWLV